MFNQKSKVKYISWEMSGYQILNNWFREAKLNFIKWKAKSKGILKTDVKINAEYLQK